MTVSPWYRRQIKGIYELFRALQICRYHLYLHISPKVLGVANKEAGWTPITTLLIRLYHRITLVSPTKKGVYKLFRALYNITYICLHQSPKVLGIANKEAGWTPFTALLICLHHRITLVSPTKKGIYELFRSFIDLPISPTSAYINHQMSWVSLTKKRVGRHLQLY